MSCDSEGDWGDALGVRVVGGGCPGAPGTSGWREFCFVELGPTSAELGFQSPASSQAR